MFDNADRWSLVEEAFTTLCVACNAGRFVPLLEADVAGYVYYSLVTKLGGDARCIHLDTRLFGPKDNEKYDLVIGECVGTDERKRLFAESAGEELPENLKRVLMSKAVISGFRTAVRGEVIVEFKCFASGFAPPQLNRRLNDALDDLRKLAALANVCREGRAVALFDDKGHLTPARQQDIVAARPADDSLMRVYVFQRNSAGEMKWRVL